LKLFDLSNHGEAVSQSSRSVMAPITRLTSTIANTPAYIIRA